jgi:hypothetical protein
MTPALLAILLILQAAAPGGTARISGTLSGPQGPLAGAKIIVDQYADKACVETAQKQTPSEADKQQLSACHKAEFRTAKTSEAGAFEISDLPPAWYSVTFNLVFKSRPGKCTSDADGAQGQMLVAAFQRMDGTHGVIAIGSPFELKAADRIRRSYECR